MNRGVRRAFQAAGFFALGFLAIASPTAGQTPDRALAFEDLGFDRPQGASVRGVALAAFDASVNDATALAYNPAGLARIKRISGIASFAGLHTAFDYSYNGASRSSDLDEYALQFLGAAFPLPVLRGSLVPAVGVERLFTSSLDVSYEGFNAPDNREDRLALRQSGGTYAYHFGAAIDLSGAFTVGADLMILDGGVDRIRQYDTRAVLVSPNVHTFVYEDMNADIDGYGGRFGMEFYALERLQIGIAVTTPLSIQVKTTTVSEVARQVDNDIGSFTRTTQNADSKYRTPYRIDGAFAVPVTPALLLTVQVGVSDWSTATIDDERLLTDDLQSVLRDVVDVRAGVEWTLARWPLRARAGFAHARSSAVFLEADRIDDDRLEQVDVDSGMTRYSLGIGWLFCGSLVLDAAVAHASEDHESETIGDARTATSVSIGCGYWF